MSQAHLMEFPIPNHQAVVWRESYGAAPSEAVIELEADAARACWRKYRGQEVTLSLSANGKAVNHQGLRILRMVPGSEGWFIGLVVVDLRWAWHRAHVLGRYNLRRKSGNRRIVRRDVLGNALIVDDIEYHPASLDPPFAAGGVPWTPGRVLKDVLRQINGQLPAAWQFAYKIEALEPAARPENLELDDDGAAAAKRALALIAGAGIRVTPDKRVIVQNRLDGSEDRALDNRHLAQFRRTPGIIVADNSEIAPSEIAVLFTREPELRFDFRLESGATVSRGPEGRILENVVAIPDQDLDGYPPGTWVTFDKAFDLWGRNPITGQALSHEFVARQWLNPHFLMGLAEFGEPRAELAGDQAEWAARAAMIYRHYFQTFRLPRRWVDRILRLQASRVAILDTETGTRAPAQAWQDFALRYGDRAQRLTRKVLLARNIDGYNEDLGSGRISPAVVTILDADEGVVRVDIQTDAYGFAESTVPAALDNVPTAQVGDVEGRPRWFGELRGGPGGVMPRLTRNHRMAMVLSAVPAAPIGLQQLHRVPITPADLAADFPNIAGRLPDARGPAWTIRIPASVETARIAWQDGAAQVLEACFGLTEQPPETLSQALGGLLVNGDALQALAKAAAAVVYAGFINRRIGTRTEHLNDKMPLWGAMRALVHRVGRESASTTVELDEELPGRDLFALLPEEVLTAVRRMVK